MPKVRDDALRNNQRPLPEISAGRVVSRRGRKVRGTRGTSEGNEVGVSGGGRSVGQSGPGSARGGVSPGVSSNSPSHPQNRAAARSGNLEWDRVLAHGSPH